MKSVFSKLYVLGVLAVLGLSAAAQAAPSITLGGDTGTWRVTTYNNANIISGTGSSPLINPYGVPPLPSVVTVTPASFAVVFTPTADFMAYASNSGGPNGKSVQMDGKLDLYFSIDANVNTKVQLTTNIYEDGVYSITGNGTFGVTGGAVVTPVDPVSHVALEAAHTNSPQVFSASGGGWKLYEQVSAGFTTSYNTYKISIDNTLLAESLSAQAGGSAYVAKKDFTIIFTTDGSSGGPPVPEPASLGVLALGGLALLARRRRA